MAKTPLDISQIPAYQQTADKAAALRRRRDAVKAQVEAPLPVEAGVLAMADTLLSGGSLPERSDNAQARRELAVLDAAVVEQDKVVADAKREAQIALRRKFHDQTLNILLGDVDKALAVLMGSLGALDGAINELDSSGVGFGAPLNFCGLSIGAFTPDELRDALSKWRAAYKLTRFINK